MASIAAFFPLVLAASATSSFSHKRDDNDNGTSEEVFEITALSGTFPSTGPYGTGPIASSLQITLSYPSPDDATNASATTTCSYSWPSTTPPGPTDWTECADPSLQWRLPADGWTGVGNYVVEVYECLSGDGVTSGLLATHGLAMRPAQPSDPDAYLSCLQMGSFTPYVCTIDGPLSARHGAVVMDVEAVDARPA
ncbi:hypothetical protein F5Y17DRAFT_455026 [Xylariaceae sp. FL0594]|nr:hypothetical protein F5Y17DRAFT_455026 [Xylariaceae sp. FL0594]